MPSDYRCYTSLWLRRAKNWSKYTDDLPVIRLTSGWRKQRGTEGERMLGMQVAINR